MKTIPINDYPQNKDWNDKINSTPSIPGGKDKLLVNLRLLLLEIKNSDEYNKVPTLEDSNSKSTLHDLCVHQLSPMRFVLRDKDGNWVLGKEAEIWLESEDDLFLAAYYCAHVKFFSEILFYLDSPKTSRELFNIAVNDYDLSWKIVTTINNRLIWLRQFGLIDFQEFSLLYSITEKGKAFLKTVHPVMPDSILQGNDETESETDFVIDEPYLSYYKENNNTVRKAGFGYLPGKFHEIDKNLLLFLNCVDKDNHIESINDFTFKTYGIKDSSTRSALNTVSSFGFIVRKTNTTYELTDLGSLWQNDASIVNLLPLFQLRYLFFFELLVETDDNPISAKELAALAKITYGFDKESVFHINDRISILKQAKLLMNVSAEKYILTHRGKLFLEKYGDLFGLESKESVNEQKPNKGIDIITELRLASKDSFNPNRFEKAVRDFFNSIGFSAEWLGGSGNTDVLLKSNGAPSDSYVVTVDAKSTASNLVSDGLVDFDTLHEHQKKHGSDYIAIVGRGFNERLIKRAKEHNVVLLDVDSLEKLFNIQKNTPLKLSYYRRIFEQAGEADISVLDECIRETVKVGLLIVGIMDTLIKECMDPITMGKLSVRDLYMFLRNDTRYDTPQIDDIKTALDFLSSPVIGCVKQEKDYYYAVGSLEDMARTLSFIQTKCLLESNPNGLL